MRWLPWYMRPYLLDESDRPIAYADHHREYWAWVWQVDLGQTPIMAGIPRDGLIAVWPRGGAKSTSVEMATAALAARGRRRYALYVCGTQQQADDHVANVGEMLTGEKLAEDYPEGSPLQSRCPAFEAMLRTGRFSPSSAIA